MVERTRKDSTKKNQGVARDPAAGTLAQSGIGLRPAASRPSHLQTQFALGDLTAAEFRHESAFKHHQDAVR